MIIIDILLDGISFFFSAKDIPMQYRTILRIHMISFQFDYTS